MNTTNTLRIRKLLCFDSYSVIQKHNVEEVKACMEATGCYSEALAEFLHNAGHFVSVLIA